MTRVAVFVACVAVLCLTTAIDVQAEPIRITGGSLVFSSGDFLQAGALSIVGTRGFSMDGSVPTDETSVGAVHGCAIACEPGTTLPAGVNISGFGFDGTATLDGKTYPNVDSQLSPNHVNVRLTGTMDIPAFGAQPVTVHAPLTANGEFFLGDVLYPFSVPIHGRAILTMNLAPGPLGTEFDFWHLVNARYDFIASPVPEPATLLLVGSGLFAAFRARTPRPH